MMVGQDRMELGLGSAPDAAAIAAVARAALWLDHPLDLTGLRAGTPMGATSSLASGTLPDRIHPYHEIGRHSGQSDAAVHALEDVADEGGAG